MARKAKFFSPMRKTFFNGPKMMEGEAADTLSAGDELSFNSAAT